MPPLADGESYLGNVNGVIKAVSGGAMAGLISGQGATLTISSGIITPTHKNHLIDTEGGAGSDDLDTISTVNALPGDPLVLRDVDNARDVRFVDLSGNILTRTGGNQTLINTTQQGNLILGLSGNWLMDRFG